MEKIMELMENYLRSSTTYHDNYNNSIRYGKECINISWKYYSWVPQYNKRRIQEYKNMQIVYKRFM